MSSPPARRRRRPISWLLGAAAVAAAGAAMTISNGSHPSAAAVASPLGAWADPVRRWDFRVAVPNVTSLAWLPDSRRLAILSDANRHIQLLDRRNGRVVEEIQSTISMGHPIVVVNGGRNLVSSRWPDEGENEELDVLTVLGIDPLRVERHIRSPLRLLGNANADTVATNCATHLVASTTLGGGGGTFVHDTRDWSIKSIFDSTKLRLFPKVLGLTADNLTLISGDLDGKISLCNIASSTCGLVHDVTSGAIQHLIVSPDGSRLIVGIGNFGHYGTTKEQYDREFGHLVRILSFPDLKDVVRVKEKLDWVGGLDLHPTEPLLAVSTATRFFLIDTDSGETVTQVDSLWNRSNIGVLAFSPDGECLAVGYDTHVSLYCKPSA